MAHRKPNPNRFLEYEEFKNGKGFTIQEKGRYIDFYFDDEGGWFDEFGNYYNSNGESDKPNQASLRFWSTIKHKYFENDLDDIDDMLNQYEDDYDSENDDNADDLEREFHNKVHIDKMRKRLSHYGDQEEIKIRFSHHRWQTNEQDIIHRLSKDNVKHVYFNYKATTNYKTGTGTLVAYNKKCADYILSQHNVEINHQPIEFEIDAIGLDDSDDELVNIQTFDPQLQQLKQQQEPIIQQQQQQQIIKPPPPPPEVWVTQFLIVEGFPIKETKDTIKAWIESKILLSKIEDDKFEIKTKEKKDAQGKTDQYQAVKLDLGSKEKMESAQKQLETNKMYHGQRKITFSVFKLK